MLTLFSIIASVSSRKVISIVKMLLEAVLGAIWIGAIARFGYLLASERHALLLWQGVGFMFFILTLGFQRILFQQIWYSYLYICGIMVPPISIPVETVNQEQNIVTMTPAIDILRELRGLHAVIGIVLGIGEYLADGHLYAILHFGGIALIVLYCIALSFGSVLYVLACSAGMLDSKLTFPSDRLTKEGVEVKADLIIEKKPHTEEDTKQ